MGEYPRFRARGIPDVRWLGGGQYQRPQRQLLSRDVFRIIFYMPYDHPDIAAGVVHAVKRYLHAVGTGPKTITHAHLDYGEGSFRSLEQLEEIYRFLSHAGRWVYPDDYDDEQQRIIDKQGFERGVLFTGGGHRRNGYELEYRARIPWNPAILAEEPAAEKMVGLLTATLPGEYLEVQGAACVRQLVLDMASQLRFASGHAGLSLRFYWHLPRTEDALRLEPLHYPGIDLREAWGREEWMGSQVDGVHWLNFLGPPVLARLGGASALRARLRSTGTAVDELSEDRVVISLGERPAAGGPAPGGALPAYRELARVLEPWLEPIFLQPTALIQEVKRYTSLLLTEDEARRWWRRFLD